MTKAMKELSLETEVRKISEEIINELMRLMEGNENMYFKMFMRKIPENLSDCLLECEDYACNYSESQVKEVLEVYGRQSFENLVLREWGTSGDPRPRIKHLIGVLDKCSLHRMSNSLRSLLKLPQVNFDSGSILPVSEYPSATSADYSLSLDSAMGEVTNTISFDLDSYGIPHVEYKAIMRATDEFNSRSSELDGRMLGKGGYGEVFLAYQIHEKLPPAVAVKRLTKLDKRVAKKFLQELRQISTIVHDNIIRLLGFSAANTPTLCLIYEYAEGGSMRNLIAKSRFEGKYSFENRIKHLNEVASGLCYLHEERNLIHRDIKPENVLIHENVAKLCDFGFIKEADSTSLTYMVGTKGYMAPETANSMVSQMADIYSLGMVILVLMTNLEAFDESRGENIFLGDMMKRRFESQANLLEGIPSLDGRFEDQRVRLIKYALKCIDRSSIRPVIGEVCRELSEIGDIVNLFSAATQETEVSE